MKSLSSLGKYMFFCGILVAGMAMANNRGWYPTYGIFSGNNSMHGSHTYIGGSHYYGGHTYGFHGK